MTPSREIEKLQRRWDENPLGLTFAPLAEAYRKEGMYPDALELLNAGLAQHPHYVPAHIVKGRCFLDTQADHSAEAAFLRVADLDPENVIALKCLAEIAERAGRYQEAIGRLERLLDFDRSNEEATAQLDRLQMTLATPQPGQVELAPLPDPIPPGESDEVPAAFILDSVTEEVLVEVYQPIELTADPSPDFQMAGDVEDLDPSVAQGLGEAGLEGGPPAPEVAAPSLLDDGETWEAEALSLEVETPQEAEVVSVEVDDAEAVAGVEAEPELVVTETMAELFLRQGHPALALAVYTQLAGREPENQRIQDAIARLKAELEPVGGAAGLPGYAAVLTGGQSVRGLFEQLLSAGRPATERVDGLSLGAVFGEGTASAVPGPVPIGSGPSYDEFYGDDTADQGVPAPELTEPEDEDSPDDLEGFTSWLKGLKR